MQADTWYKFNDEEIEKMNNKLKLSGEDESGKLILYCTYYSSIVIKV